MDTGAADDLPAGAVPPRTGTDTTGTGSDIAGTRNTGTDTTGTEATWTIAELAAEFGITHRTIRFYEHQGLISPQRRGSHRVFRSRDRVRLALVLRGKRLGFDLAEIRRIVDMYEQPPGESGQLRYLLDQIADRRRQLEERRRDIDQTLDELAEVERRCRADLARLDGPPGTPG